MGRFYIIGLFALWPAVPYVHVGMQYLAQDLIWRWNSPWKIAAFALWQVISGMGMTSLTSLTLMVMKGQGHEMSII